MVLNWLGLQIGRVFIITPIGAHLGYWVSGMHTRRALKFLAVDGFSFVVSLVAAFLIRFDFRPPDECLLVLPEIVLWVLAAKLLVFYCFRQFHILPDYFGMRELRRLAFSSGYTSLALGLMDWEFLVEYNPPRSIFASSAESVGERRLW